MPCLQNEARKATELTKLRFLNRHICEAGGDAVIVVGSFFCWKYEKNNSLFEHSPCKSNNCVASTSGRQQLQAPLLELPGRKSK